MISMESILGVEDSIRNVDETGLNKLILKFQRKQPAVFIYLAAVSEREALNDDEQDVFFTTALVIWITLVENSRSVKKVPIRKMDELDNYVMSFLENDKAEIRTDNKESKLTEYALMRITESQSEFEVREDLKPMLFAFIKVVLDALLDARS